jgi:hypothetical protein
MWSVAHELRTPINGTTNYLEAAINDDNID